MSDECVEVGNVCIRCDELWPCREQLRAALARQTERADAAEHEAQIAGAVAQMAASDRDEALMNADETALECKRLEEQLATAEQQRDAALAALRAVSFGMALDGQLCWCLPNPGAPFSGGHRPHCGLARAVIAGQPAASRTVPSASSAEAQKPETLVLRPLPITYGYDERRQQGEQEADR